METIWYSNSVKSFYIQVDKFDFSLYGTDSKLITWSQVFLNFPINSYDLFFDINNTAITRYYFFCCHFSNDLYNNLLFFPPNHLCIMTRNYSDNKNNINTDKCKTYNYCSIFSPTKIRPMLHVQEHKKYWHLEFSFAYKK